MGHAQGRTAVILGVIRLTGVFSMLMRLIAHTQRASRNKVQDGLNDGGDTSNFVQTAFP